MLGIVNVGLWNGTNIQSPDWWEIIFSLFCVSSFFLFFFWRMWCTRLTSVGQLLCYISNRTKMHHILFAEIECDDSNENCIKTHYFIAVVFCCCCCLAHRHNSFRSAINMGHLQENFFYSILLIKYTPTRHYSDFVFNLKHNAKPFE